MSRIGYVLPMGLGERIREEREARGWTASDLARYSGVSKQHLSRVEAGERGLGCDKLVMLARALGIRPGELLDEVEIDAEVEAIDDVYPSRTRVLLAIGRHFPADVVEELARLLLPDGASDPGEIWWSRMLHSIHERRATLASAVDRSGTHARRTKGE